MNLLLLVALLFVQTDSTLFKPKDEFEIKLDYQFKRKPVVQFNGYNTEPAKNNQSATSYVILNVKVLKASPGEAKILVNSNLQNNLFNRKVEDGTSIKLDLGFTDDIKNRIAAHEYIINFLNAQKSILHKILIQIDEDGLFHVNGETRGKF